MGLKHRMASTLFFPFLRNILPRIIAKKELSSLGGNYWSSFGNDPQFLVRSPRLKMLTGWVSISVEMDSKKIVTPKVYLDYGDGFSEQRTIALYQTGAYTYRAEIVLPSTLKAMRLDPAEEACEFSIKNIRVSAHSEALHIIHQFASIAKHDFSTDQDVLRIFKKSYARWKKHGLNGMLERLDKEYKTLHPYLVQRASSQHIAYMNWIRMHETGIGDAFDTAANPYRPLISVVMPTFNTDPDYLKEAIESVISQSYPNWELCIADDASSHQDTIHLLNAYRERYENIYVYFRENNGLISKATNTALGLARGEYVVFMDHNDKLAPHALKEVVELLNRRSGLKLIYSDEDKIDEAGNRYDPHFKSGWNPDMLFSQNYISHLTVMRRDVVKACGGLRTGFEGAQDHDLLLRALKYMEEGEIGRIEKILYHSRSIEGSTAGDAGEKNYMTRSGVKALQDYFDDVNPGTVVLEGLLPNTYHPIHPIPGIPATERIKPYIENSQINREIYQRLSTIDNQPKTTHDSRLTTDVTPPLVSLIIPTRDGYDILSKCIESILEKTTYSNYEIIVVDNQTTDSKTIRYLESIQKHFSRINVLKYDRHFNYSAINNFAVSQAKGDIIGLINNDVEVITPEWLTEMVAHAWRPEIGAVGTKLSYSNGTIQHGGVILGIGGVAGHSHKHVKFRDSGYFSRLVIIQNYAAVTAACLLVKKKNYDLVKGLDELGLPIAFNDVDFCLKLCNAGLRNLWTPFARLYHHESVSRGQESYPLKRKRFNGEEKTMKDKWGTMLEHDNLYNRNLTLKREDFSLRGPCDV